MDDMLRAFLKENPDWSADTRWDAAHGVWQVALDHRQHKDCHVSRDESYEAAARGVLAKAGWYEV